MIVRYATDPWFCTPRTLVLLGNCLSKVHIRGSMTSDNYFNNIPPRNSIQRVALMATCHPDWKTLGNLSVEPFHSSTVSSCYLQFSSVAQSCPTLCDPMDCSTPGLSVLHQLLELTQTHVHWVRDAIQPSHPLSSPSPPAFNLSQHQGLFQWVSSSHQVAKELELQPQHQSFQWIFRTDFL